MAKFMVLYSSTMTASDLMANATPEQMKASMDEWIQWKDEASKTVKVEFGLPLQAVDEITSSGTTESDSAISGYSILEGEKDQVVEVLKSHPHLKRPGADIDLFEMLSMPGL